ncbi:hypothetical protein ACFQWB_10890 [Paenibacillus thermoaerophilus]|uniref:Uncharacterized protein n=1 Tax=Paenibacillus thermoaerophilus TaxID=1215385 RepID=A0ABW2V6D6_9BACL|nr:hypothetical protein [Paenibacillus thermoaerophilus]TMV18732.1 hypothetical protein FE781_02005 [Paenibacillus thermoaerophilus]
MRWSSFVIGGLAGAAVAMAMQRRKSWNFAWITSGNARSKLVSAAETAKAAIWALTTIVGRMGETAVKRAGAITADKPSGLGNAGNGGHTASASFPAGSDRGGAEDLSKVQNMINQDPELKQTVDEITSKPSSSSKAT